MAYIKIQNGITRHPEWRMKTPINLEILHGEQVAIVGDNASGKSRLVEVITGHFPLLMNEVYFDFGEDALPLASENLRYITFRDAYGEADGTYYYQQRWNQHDIGEGVPTLRQWLQKSKTTATSETNNNNPLIDKFLLHEGDENQQLLDAPIITLSSGELRRAQLARAMKGNPKLLILDNPFIGLDAEARLQLNKTLEWLIRDADMQIILVLNRTNEIPEFITHILPVEDITLKEKITREEFMRGLKHITTPVLPCEKKDWIIHFPQRNIEEQKFYPQEGGEILCFNSVSIRYGNRTILQDLNWTVREGERWALSGKNGSGKSTLLSLVCADNPQAYACDIRLFGHKRGTGESIWEIKRHIGYVSPEMHRAYQKDIPAIDIVASGLNDSVGLYVRPRPEQREVCRKWMELFGIEDLADRTFLKLSSGEQRLCLLARAFVKDPELLILDEPFHGVDLCRRTYVKEIIEAFCQREHKTLVVVTHHPEELPGCITHHLNLQKNG